MYDAIKRYDEDELLQDAEEQAMIAEFVDADSTEEEMDVVVMLIDMGKTRAEIRATLVAANEAIERSVWS